MIAYDGTGAMRNKGHMKENGRDLDNRIRTLVVFPKCTLTLYETRINWRTTSLDYKRGYDKKAQGAWQSFKNRKTSYAIWDLTRAYAGKWDKMASSYECSCR